MKEFGPELVAVGMEIAAQTGIHVVETAVPAVGGWWRHHRKVPSPKVGVEFGMIVAAVDLVETVDLVEPVEPVEFVEHMSEYFQVKHFPSVQESR